MALCFVAASYSLHRDCSVTALQCRNKVMFTLTGNAMSSINLWQKLIYQHCKSSASMTGPSMLTCRFAILPDIRGVQ